MGLWSYPKKLAGVNVHPSESNFNQAPEPRANGDVTVLLDRWSRGDETALHELLPVVYDELRRLAGHYLKGERAGHTLQPTSLVHEAYLRLRGLDRMRLTNRAHFFGAAAQVMRRVLVDHARARNAQKRGRGEAASQLTFDAAMESPAELVALDDALDTLSAIDPAKAKVVELRFFGGLTIDETADYLNVAPVTVKRHWAFARAWLYRQLAVGNESEARACEQ